MARTIPESDHLKFNEPSIWIPLFEVELPTETKYLTPNPATITYAGNTYEYFPMILEEVSDDGKGEITSAKLICSDVEGVLSSALLTYGSIDGYSVKFYVYSVDISDVVYEEDLEIIKCTSVNKETVTFDLGMFNPITIKLLQQKFLTDFCWNIYKEDGCYILDWDGTFIQPSGFLVTATDSCDKNMANCILHNNVLRFNGFPGIPGRGGFV